MAVTDPLAAQKKAYHQDLLIEQGSYYDIGFDWTDTDNVTPLPIGGWNGGWEGHMQVRARRSTTAALYVDLSSEVIAHDGNGDPITNGITFTEPNRIGIHLTDDQTSLIPRDAVYDLYIRRLGGEWFRFAEGDVTLDKTVTVNA